MCYTGSDLYSSNSESTVCSNSCYYSSYKMHALSLIIHTTGVLLKEVFSCRPALCLFSKFKIKMKQDIIECEGMTAVGYLGDIHVSMFNELPSVRCAVELQCE